MSKFFPDFLVIGACRSGTTWLYKNLKQQEKIWMPPQKELHYFDKSIEYHSPSFLYDQNLFRRLFGTKKYHKNYRKRMTRFLGKNILSHNKENILWGIKYFFKPVNDDWYLDLFREGGDLIKGEITPAYQLLTKNDIARVYKILPQAKIIFLLRNPIHRTWSQLRKNKQTNRSLSEIKRKIQTPGTFMRNDYLRTLDNWCSYFPKSQFKIAFFDDILNSPDLLLETILNFLEPGIANAKNLQFSADKVNAAPSLPMSGEVKKLLTNELKPLMVKLADRIPGYPEQWLSKL